MSDFTSADGEFAVTAATPAFSVTWMYAPTDFASAAYDVECLRECSSVDDIAMASCYPTDAAGIDNLFSSMATMTAGDEAAFTSMWSVVNEEYHTMLDCICGEDLVAPWVSGSVSGVCDSECATETNTASLTAAAEAFSSMCSLVSANALAADTTDSAGGAATTTDSSDDSETTEEVSASGTSSADGEGSATGLKISGLLLFGLLGLGVML